MKLRSESVENADCSGRKGEFKGRFLGSNRIEIPSRLKIKFELKKRYYRRSI